MNTIKTVLKIEIFALFIIILLCGKADAKTVAKQKCNGYTIAVTQSKAGTKVRWNNKVIRWYDFSGKVKIISEKKLTNKMLYRRKNRILYIERIVGKCINNNLDGITSCGSYISYRSQRGYVHKGDTVVTYCVYCPYTHWTDDIDERYDVVIKRG